MFVNLFSRNYGNDAVEKIFFLNQRKQLDTVFPRGILHTSAWALTVSKLRGAVRGEPVRCRRSAGLFIYSTDGKLLRKD